MSDKDTTADSVEVDCHEWTSIGFRFRGETTVSRVGLNFHGDDDVWMFRPDEAIKLAATIRRAARKAQGGKS